MAIARYAPGCWGFDDEFAGYDLTTILIRQGHHRIALLVGTKTFVTSVQEGLRGCRRALEEHGVVYGGWAPGWMMCLVRRRWNYLPSAGTMMCRLLPGWFVFLWESGISAASSDRLTSWSKRGTILLVSSTGTNPNEAIMNSWSDSSSKRSKWQTHITGLVGLLLALRTFL